MAVENLTTNLRKLNIHENAAGTGLYKKRFQIFLKVTGKSKSTGHSRIILLLNNIERNALKLLKNFGLNSKL